MIGREGLSEYRRAADDGMSAALPHHERVDGRYFSTMSAVTIPNMPFGISAWGRMWQWNAHTPGLLQFTITSQRSPGATLSVSHFQGAGCGQPSLSITV